AAEAALPRESLGDPRTGARPADPSHGGYRPGSAAAAQGERKAGRCASSAVRRGWWRRRWSPWRRCCCWRASWRAVSSI
ncbi:MAG: hypothetical protein AVDCRST_MAG27-3712, partial [uncultured Craurococcus sp.]